MRVKAKVAVALPPRELPMHKEWEIGRNDPCPCGKYKESPIDVQLDYKVFDESGTVAPYKFDPGFKAVKYKDCCMKTGKYENYKTV
jgi:hypothetical protein